MLITILKSQQTQPSSEILAEAEPFSLYLQNSVNKLLANEPDFTVYQQYSEETQDVFPALVTDSPPNSSNPISNNYCNSPDFIESQIPFWIKQNYGTQDNDNYLISFLREYYNWLYCGFKKPEYQLTPYDISELFDIDLVPEAFLELYVKTYAPFIKWTDISIEEKQNIRRFLKSIKTNFLIKKGTENSYRHLLKELFNITNVNFDYPKKYLARLNGGKYIGIPWYVGNTGIIDLPQNFDPKNPVTNDIIANSVGYNTQTRPNLFGSALNESVLPDNKFWHDYSYLLTSDAEVTEVQTYKTTVLNAAHPAGTIAFFEQYVNIDDTDIESDEETIFTSEYLELPEIGRYLLFYPGITVSNQIGVAPFYNSFTTPPDSCDSVDMYSCYCCNNYCDPNGGLEQKPQHRFPGEWVPPIRQETRGKTIAHMKIERMVLGLTGTYLFSNAGRDTCANLNCPVCV